MARRWGETVSSPASLSSQLLPSTPLNSVGPDPCVGTGTGTGSGRGLGCTRSRATARHDRKDCKGTCHGNGTGTDGLPRSTLRPHHRSGDKVVKRVGQTARARASTRAASRRSTGSAQSCPSAPSSSSSSLSRLSTPRSSSTYTASSKSIDSRRNAKLHARVTRANCRMTDPHGNQLSPTAHYLSCELSPSRHYLCMACDTELIETFPSQTTTFAVCDNPGATLSSDRPRLTSNSHIRGYQGAAE